MTRARFARRALPALAALLLAALLLGAGEGPVEDARRLLVDGDDTAALAALDPAPLTFEALYLRGVALYRLGRDAESLAAFRAVLGGPREDDARYYQHLLAHRAGGTCPVCGLRLSAGTPVAAGNPAAIVHQPLVRVLLLASREPVALAGEGECRVTDLATGAELFRLTRLDAAATAAGGTVRLGDRPTGKQGVVLAADSPLAVGPRRYRGELILIADRAGQLKVINRLGVEEYLYGVLKREISPTWPPAALRAQAIAARTFALCQAAGARNREYDLGDDYLSQVYGGVNHEDPACQAAVDATAGLVLRHRGALIPTYFHSDSGGRTAGADEAWSSPRPYTVSRDDPWSDSSPYHSWEWTVSGAELGRRLARHNLGTVTAISILDRSASGRIKTIHLQGSRRRTTLAGNQFRMDAGPNEVRSTLIDSIEKRGGNFTFRGRGWGHGVGLAQWSAKAMAEAGWDETQILEFFYQGIELGPFDDGTR